MDEAATPAGRALAGESPIVRRLEALARTISPLEIAELWVFPPLAELESSAEFFLFTRFHSDERLHADERRTLYSARLLRENGSENGSGARQVVVEHGSVPADRVPLLVERLQRRLGDEGQPLHAVIEGSSARWRALFEEAAAASGADPGGAAAPAAANGGGIGEASGPAGNGTGTVPDAD